MVIENAQNVLLMISLAIFFIELVLFQFLKNKINNSEQWDIFLEQAANILNEITFSHILIYTSVYSFVLLLCKWVPFLYSILITFQLISLTFDVYMLKKITP